VKTFDVLTVTKRTGWEAIAYKSLERQTVASNIRWIVVHEEPLNLRKSSLNICPLPAPPKTKLSNLNASFNKGLGHVISDYVIFYDDFIELKEDCFEKLLELANERTWVTTCAPNYDGSDDGRYTGTDLPRQCRPEEWEINVGIAPMQMIRELGGFDERLDNGWAWGNALLARKAAMVGAKFICDESNRPKLYPHEMSSHETLPKNGQICEQIISDIRNGKESISCNMI
jgi:hypothetical protein